jgi:hypothetical protein
VIRDYSGPSGLHPQSGGPGRPHAALVPFLLPK